MTASTEIIVRPSDCVTSAEALAGPLRPVNVTVLATVTTGRRTWKQQLPDLPSCPPTDGLLDDGEDDDLWVDEDCWVSPMAGSKQPPVVMDWAGLDWSRGGAA